MNAGGHDNITVVLIRVSQNGAAEADDSLGPLDPDG
jgi:serine/threonine protein phosphatase PrpC